VRKTFYLRVVLRYSPFLPFKRKTFFRGICTSAQPIALLDAKRGGAKGEEILNMVKKQLERDDTILIVFAVSELGAPLDEFGMEQFSVVDGMKREGEMLAQAQQIGINRFKLLEALVKKTVMHH
jgi:hypothetical protein